MIVISGPTASGKTSLSISLAKQLNTCILSADSRQFYREVSIGTAKPDLEEQDGIKHYFIDSHSLEDEVTASRYEEEALAILDKEFKSHDTIILVGGSGMFIDALCIGLDPIPSNPEMRKSIQQEFDQFGLSPLLEELKQKDPEYFDYVDKKNPMRILRAIEVLRLTNKTYTSQRQRKPKKRPFQVTRFAIDHNREKLYERINLRVDLMIQQGLIEEAKSVQHLRHLTSMNTVGYKELFNYFDGNQTLEEAILEIKQNSRRYAKRQITWMKRHPSTTWISASSPNEMTQIILESISSS